MYQNSASNQQKKMTTYPSDSSSDYSVIATTNRHTARIWSMK